MRVILEGVKGGFHAEGDVDNEKLVNIFVIERNGRFYLFDRASSRRNTQVYVETTQPMKVEF